MLRAFVGLSQRRLLGAAASLVAFVLLGHMWVSAETPWDVGVFWHHFCGCPADPDDAAVLLRSVNVMAAMVGGILGFNMLGRTPAAAAVSDTRRFLLTRPVSRLGVQGYPLLIAVLAVAVLPVGAWALLVGWLRLVHAPSLGHLAALVGLMPGAAQAGPHASLWNLAWAVKMGRLYAASVSVGLLLYALFNGSRWFLVSPRGWLRIAGAVWMMSVWLVAILPKSWRVGPAILLIQAGKGGLGYVPSDLGIGLHFAAAAVLLVAAYWTMREAEL